MLHAETRRVGACEISRCGYLRQAWNISYDEAMPVWLSYSADWRRASPHVEDESVIEILTTKSSSVDGVRGSSNPVYCVESMLFARDMGSEFRFGTSCGGSVLVNALFTAHAIPV